MYGRSHRRHSSHHSAFFGTLSLLLFGCSANQSTATPASVSLLYAIVYGRITDSSGSPLINARVRADANSDEARCRTGQAGSSARAQTDSLGKYRMVLETPFLPRTMCISILVVRDGSAETAASLGGGANYVRLSSFRKDGKYDSVAVNHIVR
jgi:hypothetical protein